MSPCKDTFCEVFIYFVAKNEGISRNHLDADLILLYFISHNGGFICDSNSNARACIVFDLISFQNRSAILSYT